MHKTITIEGIGEIPLLDTEIIAGGKEGKIISATGKRTGITLQGLRPKNEDGILVTENLIAVADGLGGYGHEGGEIASKIALTELLNHGNFDISTIISLIQIELQNKVNDFINGKKSDITDRSATTLAVVQRQISDTSITYHLAHIGDSKIYVISTTKGELTYTTEDELEIRSLIKKVPITRYTSNRSHIVSNALSALESKLKERHTIKVDKENDDGLIFIAVSDGISDFITPEEITRITLENRKTYVDDITRLALQRQKSEHITLTLNGEQHTISHLPEKVDNISIVSMDETKPKQEQPKQPKKPTKPSLLELFKKLFT